MNKKKFFALCCAFLGLSFLFLTAIGAIGTPDPTFKQALWAGDSTGLFKLDAETGETDLHISQLQDVRALAVDEREGLIWAFSQGILYAYQFDGTQRLAIPVPTNGLTVSELLQLHQQPVSELLKEVYCTTDSLLPNTVPAEYLWESVQMTIDQDNGEVFIGYGNKIHQYSTDGDLLSTITTPGLVTALTFDPARERIWAAVCRGVYSYERDGTVHAQTRTNTGWINSLDFDSTLDQIWAAENQSIKRFDEAAEQVFSSGLDATFLASDGTGKAWVSSQQNLRYIDETGQTLFSLPLFQGQLLNEITALAVDKSDQSAWASSQAGIKHVSKDGQILHEISMHDPILEITAQVLSLSTYSDRIPPEIWIDVPLQDELLNFNQPSLEIRYSDIGQGVDPDTLNIQLDSQPAELECSSTAQMASCQFPEPLAEGSHFVTTSVEDYAGNRSQVATVDFHIDTMPPGQPEAGLISVGGTDENGIVEVVGQEGAVEGGSEVTLENVRSGEVVTVFANPDGSFSAQIGAEPGDEILVTSNDEAGNTSNKASVWAVPPDPATIAPPLSETEITPFHESVSFLYSGSNAVQRNFDESAIDAKRVAVVRGRVLDATGAPLPGVVVSIHNHDEFGYTQSRKDGWFDLVVNGGGHLTVSYYRHDLIPVHRKVDVPWRDYTLAPNIVMTAFDEVVTSVDLTANQEYQTVRGSAVSDTDGARQATLLFQPGTIAEMHLPDGSTQELENLHVRATELTVGEMGPKAMPADLPPTTAYTYAVEYSIDEAQSVGTASVTFSKPVWSYVENFIDFPVGTAVPAGWYDRDAAVWVPSENGRVIKILGIEEGKAVLDVRGDNQPATQTELEELSAEEAELSKLAEMYQPGVTLWRVPIGHFSLWDYNWPYGPPPDAEAPVVPDIPVDNKLDDPCLQVGSIIECQNQVLGESIPVAGTGFSLNYRSDRVVGRTAEANITIPITGSDVSDYLKRVELRLSIGGKVITKIFSRPGPNEEYVFSWDKSDVYGRRISNSARLFVEITNVYQVVYYSSSPEVLASFGRVRSDTATEVDGDRERAEVYLTRKYDFFLNVIDIRLSGLSGWALSPHHIYDPNSKILYFGDGRRKSARNISRIIDTFGGILSTEGYGTYDDGVHARDAIIDPRGLAIASDGSVFMSEYGARVRRIDEAGIITTVAGSRELVGCGEDGPALETGICDPFGIDIGPDGSVYIADVGNFNTGDAVRRLSSDGTLIRYAGNNIPGFSGDGGPANLAQLNQPLDVAVARDGSVYITDYVNNRIRRVGTDGIITTVAGSGGYGYWGGGYSGDGGPATKARLRGPTRLDIGPDGSIYFVDGNNFVVRRIGNDGIITTVAGNGTKGLAGDGGPAIDAELAAPVDVEVGSDGSLYILGNGDVRRVGADGIINTVAGTGWAVVHDNDSPDAGPAAGTPLQSGYALALSEEVDLYIGTSGRIRKVSDALPAFSEENIVLSSDDGRELYEFTNTGRHLSTINALTGEVIFTFEYDGQGWLSSITDQDRNTTQISRDGQGRALAIIAPDGQSTSLVVDEDNYLTSISDPLNQTHVLESSASGLLMSYENPRGSKSVFQYDALGRLIMDTNHAGGFKALSRTELPDGYQIEVASAEGRTSSYQVKESRYGDFYQTITRPDSTVYDHTINRWGEITDLAADGTERTINLGPDPRFGMQAALTKSKTITTPGELTLTLATSRSSNLHDPEDLLSLEQHSEVTSINGRQYSIAYDAVSDSYTFGSPVGRSLTAVVDAASRPLTVQIPSIAALNYSYDVRGRLSNVLMDPGPEQRTIEINYNPQGYLAEIIDPLNRSVSFETDSAGRVTKQTSPDGREINFAYDANGNLTSLQPPGRDAHVFSYTAVDQQEEYAPPDVGAGTNVTSYQYNLDMDLTRITRPDGQTVDLTYDFGGRLSQIGIPSGDYGYSYKLDTGQLDTITAPSGSSLSYSYDGFLVTAESQTGEVIGNVTWTYDNNFWVIQRSVNGNAVSFSYDDDGLLVGAGAISLTRDASNGLLTGTALGDVATDRTYNPFAELVGKTASYQGTDIYDVSYARDKLGRITEKVETVDGTTTTYGYHYDLAGRLTSVKENGTTVSSYSYDSNGNRTAHNSTQGSYDAQDRLQSYGNATYAYTANGELKSKTVSGATTEYNYDVLGNLRQVQSPGDVTIDYLIDGRNRRIGKKVNGTLVQGFIYGNQLEPIAELDGNGNFVSRFIYASKLHVPDYMVKDGTTYRIISDHLGSPRLVVSATDGSIVQSLDYDEFGNITNDTNPGFQPFGFAGGVYDQHTELTRYGARDYDARIGRWTARDPVRFLGGDTNLYGYVLGDPVNFIDTNGMFVQIGVGIVIGAVSGAAGTLVTGGGIGEAAIAAGVGAVVGGLTAALPGAAGLTVTVIRGGGIGGISNAIGQGISLGLDPCRSFPREFNVGAFVGSILGGGISAGLAIGATGVSGQIATAGRTAAIEATAAGIGQSVGQQ